jgi:hypothetical protein
MLAVHRLRLALIVLVAVGCNLAAAQPSARGYVDWVYVPQVDKVLLFGGQIASGPPYTAAGETWWWNPRDGTWTEVTTPGQPGPRSAANLALHAPSGAVVMFGGGVPAAGSFTTFVETWRFDPAGEAWTLLETEGPAPLALIGDMFEYHERSGLFVLHGGFSLGTGTYLNVTRHFDLESRRWIRVTPQPSPPGRNYNAFANDPATQRLVMSGGREGGFDETWLYDPGTSTWQQAARQPQAGVVPYARMVHDADSGTLVRFGGEGVDADVVWTYDARRNAWSSLATTGDGPGALSRHAMTSVPGLGVVVFGGLPRGEPTYTADVWVLDVTKATWTKR